MPFLSDLRYLKYKGFKVCDTAKPYYELLYLPFKQNAPAPFTTYSFFHDGMFVTNEIFSASKFVKFLEEKGFVDEIHYSKDNRNL